MEATGNQLAEAMGVSFTGELGPRLRRPPFRQVGEKGVAETIAAMLAKNSKKAEDVSASLGAWGSSWLLKAAADDKPMPMGGPMPGSFGGEAAREAVERATAEAAADEEKKKEEL